MSACLIQRIVQKAEGNIAKQRKNAGTHTGNFVCILELWEACGVEFVAERVELAGIRNRAGERSV